MHLINAYALHCGAKITKTAPYQTYFPVPVEKYVVFHPHSKVDSKNYLYWQDVLDIIVPILKKHDISVVQIGSGAEQGYQRIYDLRGRLNFSQVNYVVRQAQLYLGVDGYSLQVSSIFGIPNVSLFGPINAEVSKPFFSNENDSIIFKGYERVGNAKPSYSATEQPRSLSLIKPEEIADAVLKLLHVDEKAPFTSVHIGSKYSQQVFRELIPNHQDTIANVDAPIEIRCDLDYNEDILVHHLNYLQRPVIITNRSINLDILRKFKPRIPLVVYKITSNDEPSFVSSMIALGINVLLLSEMSKEEVNTKKIRYYEFGKINSTPISPQETLDALKSELPNLYFRSSKIIMSHGKVYASHASLAQGIELVHDYEYQKVIDVPEFWKDLDFFAIVKKL